MLALAGAALGCDQGTAKVSDGQRGPPPTVKWHYPEGKGATNGTIRAQFDRFLSSDTANRQGFCVSTSANPDDCLGAGSGAGAVTFAVEYDPVDRVVVLKPPVKGLEVGLYKVRVLAPKNATDTTGIRSFDGVPMAEEFSWEFTVDASTPALEPIRAVDYCGAETACLAEPDAGPMGPPVQVQDSVGVVMRGTCGADTTCHQTIPPDEPHKLLAGNALILDDDHSDPAGTSKAIRRIVSQRQVAPQTATDPDPGVARTTGQDTFARNMPYIDPKNPGNSFILYKMILGQLHCPAGLGDDAVDPAYCSSPDGTYGTSARYINDSYGVDGGACGDTILHKKGDRIISYPTWVPEDKWKSPAPGEYARLRYHIRGNPMPSPGGASPPQDIHRLSAWIAAGAPVKDCPVAP